LKVATADNIAILKFSNRADLIEYLRVPVLGKRPEIFGPRQLAKLLHQCHGKADLAVMQAEDKDGFATNSER
jgi:hypothetical protein